MNAEASAGLAPRLAARIAASGPITIAEYMESCLADPEHGYYMHRDPLGLGGDFITAPEISQIFGELIGLWCAQVWRSMGSPSPLLLLELGPGRGTLMADALRAAGSVAGFIDVIQPVLVETSPALAAIQRATLGTPAPHAVWHQAIEEAPAGAMIVVANEFLDALPIRQLEYSAGHWLECCVGFSPGGEFVRCLRPLAEPDIDYPGGDPAEGDIVELRPAANALARHLGARARAHPLAALFMDYGHDSSGAGDTLQAVRAHRPADPFATPGLADLTAHVDFAALAAGASDAGLDVHGPIPQGRFLLSLGLAQRAERLMAAAADKETEHLLESGTRRLADPAQMGELFRVISLTGRNVAVPPAFEGNR